MFDTTPFGEVAPYTAVQLDELDYTVDHFDNGRHKFVDIARDESDAILPAHELSREVGEVFIEDGYAVVAVSKQQSEPDIVRIWFEELTVETIEKTVTEERITIDN